VLRLTSEHRGPLSHLADDVRGARYALTGRGRGRGRDEGVPVGWVVAGVVVVGLGLLAWSSMGADFRRYLKIKSM
jgi:hypothetical protein